MRIPSPASAWVLAASSLALSGTAIAQGSTPSQARPALSAPTPGQENAPRATGGRNQFIAPVLNMQIQGEGVALPTGVAQPEEPIKPPAALPPPAEKPTAK